MEARWMTRHAMLMCVGLALGSAAVGVAYADDDLMRDLQKVVDAGEKAPAHVLQSVRAQIEADPKSSASLIVPKLRDPQAGEAALVVYVWAVGLTNQAETADDLIALANARATQSPLLMQACLRALANVGGPHAGAFLLAQLDVAANPERRFELLNLLGQMQYEPALPKTLEVLDLDETEYWKPMFVFGKMGDAAVPFLLKQVSSEKRNVRFNAVRMLRWLLPPEAADPLQVRFWNEEDAEIRGVILATVEGALSDMSALRLFSQEVLTKEKDEKVRKFAQETVASLTGAEDRIQPFRAAKRDDRGTFQRCYTELYRSAGKEGSIAALADVSVLADEPQLKKLRERVLQRDSDEAFYDYEKITTIILDNRHVYGAAATQPTTSQPIP